MELNIKFKLINKDGLKLEVQLNEEKINDSTIDIESEDNDFIKAYESIFEKILENIDENVNKIEINITNDYSVTDDSIIVSVLKSYEQKFKSEFERSINEYLELRN